MALLFQYVSFGVMKTTDSTTVGNYVISLYQTPTPYMKTQPVMKKLLYLVNWFLKHSI